MVVLFECLYLCVDYKGGIEFIILNGNIRSILSFIRSLKVNIKIKVRLFLSY